MAAKTSSLKVRSVVLFLLMNISQCPVTGGIRSLSAEGVVVLDDMFTTRELENLRGLLSHEETLWSFSPDVRQVSPFTSRSHPWSAVLDVDLFKNSALMEKVLGALNTSGSFSPYKVEGQVSVRGDHVISSSCDRPGYSATLFLVENWSPNAYEEMVVYDQQGEVSDAIVPRYGRLVLLPCGLSRVIKPPALDVSQRFHTLSIYLQPTTTLSETFVADRQSMVDFLNKIENYYKLVLAKSLPSHPPVTDRLEVDKFVTSRFTTPGGRKILVFDGIIPESLLDSLASVVSNGVYTNSPAGEESTDNVQWILGFETEDFLRSSLWPIIQVIVRYVSGSDNFFPYDISCNNIQGRDSPKIHTDCPQTDDDYTLLIYLNANWSENLHGETIFFTDLSGRDFAFAIKPKYGRVAIFHGAIPHSGRPPPFYYQGARFTFAVKMAASKQVAYKKSVVLDIEPLSEALKNAKEQEAEKIKQIMKDIMAGRLSGGEVESILKQYEDKPTSRKALIGS